MVQPAPGQEPGFERLEALSQVLVSFYTGLERIFERVASRLDGSLPEGDRWHTQLLLQIARPTDDRAALISESTREALREYLAFRHRSRHAYPQHIQWSRMEHLVSGLRATWQEVLGEIEGFLAERRPPEDPT